LVDADPGPREGMPRPEPKGKGTRRLVPGRGGGAHHALVVVAVGVGDGRAGLAELLLEHPAGLGELGPELLVRDGGEVRVRAGMRADLPSISAELVELLPGHGNQLALVRSADPAVDPRPAHRVVSPDLAGHGIDAPGEADPVKDGPGQFEHRTVGVVEGDGDHLSGTLAAHELPEGNPPVAARVKQLELLPEGVGRDGERRRPVLAHRVVAEREAQVTTLYGAWDRFCAGATTVEGSLRAIIDRLPERLEQKERLRVLALVDHLPAEGGAEKFAAEVASRLDEERFESALCVSRGPRDPAAASASESADLEHLRAEGLRVICLGRRSTLAFWNWRPLVSLLRRERVDVLHAHMFGSNVWASLLGTVARTPAVIAHEHSWAFEGDRLRRFLDRNLIGRMCDKVIAVSREDRRRMIEIERIPEDKVEFVPLGIDALPEPHEDLRAEFGIEREAPIVGAVGGLRPEKGLLTLLDSATQLRKDFPSLRILLVGEGKQRTELTERIESLGLGEVVILAGHRRDVPAVLATLDVAVLCSTREGSPLALMEYMDAGKAIVATRVGGVPDLIHEGVQGLLVPPRDPGRLADAIGRQLRDSAEARRMGAAARERRRREFTMQNTVGRIEALYGELLAAR
jgi:glycosyltransferase involved in cell wall biosynthesis